jgi:hypothetical protein
MTLADWHPYLCVRNSKQTWLDPIESSETSRLHLSLKSQLTSSYCPSVWWWILLAGWGKKHRGRILGGRKRTFKTTSSPPPWSAYSKLVGTMHSSHASTASSQRAVFPMLTLRFFCTNKRDLHLASLAATAHCIGSTLLKRLLSRKQMSLNSFTVYSLCWWSTSIKHTNLCYKTIFISCTYFLLSLAKGISEPYYLKTFLYKMQLKMSNTLQCQQIYSISLLSLQMLCEKIMFSMSPFLIY